jgi:hypothetical protein
VRALGWLGRSSRNQASRVVPSGWGSGVSVVTAGVQAPPPQVTLTVSSYTRPSGSVSITVASKYVMFPGKVTSVV